MLIIFRSIDASKALAFSGVMDFISAKDVNCNIIGPVAKDEELFATEFVYFVGQMIGMVVAQSEPIARAASKLVKIEYDVLPALLTIEVKFVQGF